MKKPASQQCIHISSKRFTDIMFDMTQIVPTITAPTPDKYAEQLASLDFAPRLHIDITDGDFAPSQTVNLNQIYWDRGEILRQIDLHLMMKKPIEWLNQIVALAPDLVILHVESNEAHENLPKIFEHLRKFDIKVGAAIFPETNPKNVKELIKLADHVLIFGGHLGYQGGTADLKQLEKVAQINEINPHAEIAWDGGANAENVAKIACAGVQIINVGAAISKTDNPERAYQELSRFIRNLS